MELVLNLPNSLTLLRILSIPFFATMLIYGYYQAALIVFVLGAITDALDGFIARVWKKQTKFGQFLDPTADKFMLITSYILFSVYGIIPTWVTVCIITRDIIVVVGWVMFYVVYHVMIIKPSLMGKFAIAMQMVLVAYELVDLNFKGVLPDATFLIIITATATVTSGINYIYRGFKYTNA